MAWVTKHNPINGPISSSECWYSNIDIGHQTWPIFGAKFKSIALYGLSPDDRKHCQVWKLLTSLYNSTSTLTVPAFGGKVFQQTGTNWS